MKKTYQNYMIAPRENSTWWNVFKDGQFLNTVRDEEAARQVVWNETGKGEYITDEMMTPLIIVDPMGGISPTEMLEMFESIKEEKSDNFHYFNVGYKGSDELNPLYQYVPKGTNVMVDILLSVEAGTGFENFMEGIAEVFNMNGTTPHDEGEMCTKILKNGELEICQYIAGKEHSYIVPKGQWKTKQGKQL